MMKKCDIFIQTATLVLKTAIITMVVVSFILDVWSVMIR